jgi:uncharacterized protein YbjT (DUF2867 family)
MKSEVPPIAAELRTKRILVTGGTGFIGGRLVEQLINHYAIQPIVLARSKSRRGALTRIGASVEVASGAITDWQAVSAASMRRVYYYMHPIARGWAIPDHI